jgi:hypothetical protein
MVRQEVLLNQALREVLQAATNAAMGRGEAFLHRVAQHQRDLLPLTIALGRSRARQTGHETLLRELDVANSIQTDLQLTAYPTDSAAQDEARAHWVAASFAGYWLGSALPALADGMSGRAAARSANAKQSFRVDMVSATETVQAFNAERDEELDDLAQDIPRSPVQERGAPLLIPFKIWDAAGDRRTCPKCEREHGTIRPPGVGFSLGLPGSVHANCRCAIGVMLLPYYYEWQEGDEFETQEG